MIVQQIALDRIISDPRLRASKELAAAIRRDGVQWPVVLLPDSAHDGMFKVCDGDRRIDAARRAGHSTIPARTPRRIGYGQMKAVVLFAGLREPAAPLPEVHAIGALRDAGHSITEIAEQLAYTYGVVRVALVLADLPDPVQSLIETGHIGVVEAFDLELRMRERARARQAACAPREEVAQ